MEANGWLDEEGSKEHQTAIALGNARLYEEAERRRREAESLASITHLLSQSLDPQEVGQRIVENVSRLFGGTMAVLYQGNPASEDLQLLAGVGEGVDWNRTLKRGTATVGLALRERRPVTTPDVLGDPRIEIEPEARARMQRSPYRAVLAVPLFVQDEVIGALAVGDLPGRVFDPAEIRLAQTFAYQAAVALGNAQLYRRAQERAERLTALSKLTELIIAGRGSQEVFDAVAMAAVMLLGAKIARVWVDDPASRVLRVQASFGIDPKLELAVTDAPAIPYGHGISGRVLESRTAEYILDVRQDPRWLNQRFAEEAGLHACGVLPLMTGGHAVGVLAILFGERRALTSEEKELATHLANQAAIAINNVRLYETADARFTQLKRFSQLSQLVTSSHDLQQILAFAAEAAMELVGGDLARLWVVDETVGGLRLAVSKSRGGDLPAAASTEFPLGHGLVGWVVEHKTRRYSASLLEDPIQVNKGWVRAGGFVSQLAIPLRAGEQALGALMVLTKAPRRFSPAEEELLELFAAKAAMALENARLYQEAQRAYHELARTQERLTQSQKMEVIGRLAGGIAHDFNNLLTVISGRAQLLQFRLGRDHPLCRHAELIEAMATQTSTLTRQLLAFSRKQVLQPKVLDLNTLVTSMGTMLGRMINENIDLVIVRGADLGCVEADPGQMEQVIMNLAINARDAMPEGGRLTIETANGEPSESHPAETASVRHRRHVRLTVSDTGCGMDAETRAHLFEPFFTTKESGKGTGLGLATVHGIVAQSGSTCPATRTTPLSSAAC